MINSISNPVSVLDVSDEPFVDNAKLSMRDRIANDPLKFLGDTLRDLVDAKEAKMEDMMELIQEKIKKIETIQGHMTTFYTKIVKDLSTDGKKTVMPGGYPGWNQLFDLVPGLDKVHAKSGAEINYFQLNSFREHINSKCASIQNEIDKDNNEVNRELQKMDSAKQNYIENLKSIVSISMR